MKKQIYPYLLLCMAPFLWAGNFLLGKIAHNQMPPFTLAFMRWLCVIIFLLPFNYKKLYQFRYEIKSNFWIITVLALLSISIYPSFIYLGLHNTSVVHASIINSMVPIAILLCDFILSKKMPEKSNILGMLIAFIGVIIIITQGHFYSIFNSNYSLGDLEILIAVVSWALFSVLIKKNKLPFSPLFFLFITSIVGELILLPLFVIECQFEYVINFNFITLGTILYAAFFSSILAFTFWSIGVKKIGATSAAHFFNLLPLYSAVLAIFFLQEEIHAYHIIGMGLIVFGIASRPILENWKFQTLYERFIDQS